MTLLNHLEVNFERSISLTIFFILALLSGEGDDYPEGAFYMTGTLQEAFEEGKRLAAEAAASKK